MSDDPAMGRGTGLTWAAQAPHGATLAEEHRQAAGGHPALGAGAQVPHAPARGWVRAQSGAGEGHVGWGSYQRPSSPSCTSSTSSPLLRASASETPFSSSLVMVYLPGTWGRHGRAPHAPQPSAGGASCRPLRAPRPALPLWARTPATVALLPPAWATPAGTERARLGARLSPVRGGSCPPSAFRARRPAPHTPDAQHLCGWSCRAARTQGGGCAAGARGLQPRVTELRRCRTAWRGSRQSWAGPRVLTGGQHRPPWTPCPAPPWPGAAPPTLWPPREQEAPPKACLPTEVPPLTPGVLAGSAHS